MSDQPEPIIQKIRLKGIDDGASERVASVREEVKQLSTDMQQLDAQSAKGDFLSPFDETAQKAQAAIIPLEDLARAYDDVADSADNAGEKAKGGFDVGSARQTVGRAGGVLALSGNSQIAGAAGSVLGLAELGPAAAGVAAFGLALKVVTDEVGRATEVEKKRLDVERQAAHDLSSLTSQEAEEKIKAAQSSLDIDKTVNEKLQTGFDAYQDSIIHFPALVAAAVAGLDPTYNAYTDALAKGDVAVQGETALIDALTDALDNGATAAADAKAANDALAKQQLDGIALSLKIDNMTAEQRQQRMRDIDNEISLNTSLLNSHTLNYEAGMQVLQNNRDLRAEYTALSDVTSSYADQLEQEKAQKQALTDQFNAYGEAIENEGKISEQIVATTKEITDARTATIEKEKQLAEDAQANIDQIEADGEAKRAQIVQTSKDNIAKIERDAGRSEGDAVRARNVDAFLSAKQRAKDAEDDQAKSDERQYEQLTTSLSDREKAVKTSLDKQVAQTETSANKETAIKQQTLFMQQQALIKAQYDTNSIAISGSNNLRVIHGGLYNDLTTLAGNWANGFKQAIASAFGGTGTPYQETPGGSGTPFLASNAFTDAVQGVVHTTLRQIWE